MGPLGHTRRFGQFWMVTMTDPPQTGTWEIQVTAKGSPRVRVQGKEDVPGKEKERLIPQRAILVTVLSRRSLIAFALLSPDFPGLPLPLWGSHGGWTPPWPLPHDSASCRYIYSLATPPPAHYMYACLNVCMYVYACIFFIE
jgi:hypothetical protein